MCTLGVGGRPFETGRGGVVLRNFSRRLGGGTGDDGPASPSVAAGAEPFAATSPDGAGETRSAATSSDRARGTRGTRAGYAGVHTQSPQLFLVSEGEQRDRE